VCWPAAEGVPLLTIDFALLQAAGNRYVAVDGRRHSRDWAALARSITRERLAVGSNGLLVAQPSRMPDAALRMRVFNSDGSEAEMSGNGLRLFAKFVLDRGWARIADGVLHVETGAGLRSVWPRFEGGSMSAARISLGEPVFEASAIPLDPDRAELVGSPPRARLALAGRELVVVCLSLGNPHAVAFLDEPVEEFPLDRVGPAIQSHPLFPNRVNFEIVNVVDRTRLRARIFERGEGETLSSGTGSTACAVAARACGHTGDTVSVELRGGSLCVAWPGRGDAVLEGPVAEICRGSYRDALAEPAE